MSNLTLPQAAQQALDAMVHHTQQTRPIHQTNIAIEVLAVALGSALAVEANSGTASDALGAAIDFIESCHEGEYAGDREAVLAGLRGVVEAAYNLHGYAQGTREAVAFNQGARWHSALAGAAQAELVACQYGNNGYACCEGMPCKADEQNNAAAPQPAQPVAVPQGYKLVPVEPSLNMLAAISGEWHPSRQLKARQQYAAMLNAAPTPPAATVPVPALEPLTEAEAKILISAHGSRATPSEDNDYTTGDYPLLRAVEAAHADKLVSATPPATTVPVLEPLTLAEIKKIVQEASKDSALRRDGTTSERIVRAVEAAHAARLAKLNGITPPAEGA